MISLDEYTVGLLRAYLAVLDDEREAFGTGYDTTHGKLIRYPDGRALHADTITLSVSPGSWTSPGLADPAARRQTHLHHALPRQRSPCQDRERSDRARSRGDHRADLRAPLDRARP